jgi:hypothetical protein
MMLARSLPFLLGAAMLAQAPKQQPGLLPGPVKPSELTVRLDLVGRIPTKTNPTSPAAAGADLLLVDQAGFVYRWDGTRASELITPRTAPSGLKLAGAESIVNVAANTTGTRVYVMFISTTVPSGIPKRTSPRDGTDAWYVLVEYDFRAGQLSAPRPITAMQVRTEGHVGGGMTVVDDGAVLFSPGDNGDSYEDGRDYSQDPAHHLAKILRINPADGATRIVAVGVRCSQRLAAYRIGGESWLTFVDPGGEISEELNAIKLTDLLDGPRRRISAGAAAPRTAKRARARSTSTNSATRSEESQGQSPDSDRRSPSSVVKRRAPSRSRAPCTATCPFLGFRFCSAIW